MPRLRNLVCRVEWNSANHIPLQEYDTIYGDGVVQCYLAIPPTPTNFVIHLKSNGYIAPGLAMFVYIDGEYQCNRNRGKLLIPAEGVDQSDCEIDFRVRQKECGGRDGTWTGEQWQFQKVADVEGAVTDRYQHAAQPGEYGGVIEVLVLRCYHSKSSRSLLSSPSSFKSGKSSARESFVDDKDVPLMTGAMFDGSGDSPTLQSRRCSEKEDKQSGFPSVRLRGGGGPESSWLKWNSQTSPMNTKTSRSSTTVLHSPTNNPNDSAESSSPNEKNLKPKEYSSGSYAPDKSWQVGSGAHTDRHLQTTDAWTWVPKENAGIAYHRAPPNDKSKQSNDNYTTANSVRKGWDSTGSINDNTRQKSKLVSNNNNKIANQGNHLDISAMQVGNENDWENAADSDQRKETWNRSVNNDNHNVDSVDSSNTIDIDKWGTDTSQNDGWGIVGPHGNMNSGAWENWGTTSSTQQNMPTKSSSKMTSQERSLNNWPKSQNIQSKVLGPLRVPAPSNSVNRINGIVSKVPSVSSVKSAQKSPARFSSPNEAAAKEITQKVIEREVSLPGAWSPRLKEHKQKARDERIKRRATELKEVRAKALAAEVDANLPRTRSILSRTSTPISGGATRSISKQNDHSMANNEFKIHPTGETRPHAAVGEQPATPNAIQDNGPGQEMPSLAPAEYFHKIGVPHYMDTLSDPYAHFIFQYREDFIIAEMLGTNIREPDEELQERLTSLTKDELIAALVAERQAANEQDEEMTMKSSQGSAGYQPNLNAANEKLDEWGKDSNDGGGDSGQNGWENNNTGTNGWQDWNNTADDQGVGESSNDNSYPPEQSRWGDHHPQGQSNTDYSAGANNVENSGGW